MLFSDNLPILKDLPSPENIWELVEVIGKCVHTCVDIYMLFRESLG